MYGLTFNLLQHNLKAIYSALEECRNSNDNQKRQDPDRRISVQTTLDLRVDFVSNKLHHDKNSFISFLKFLDPSLIRFIYPLERAMDYRPCMHDVLAVDFPTAAGQVLEARHKRIWNSLLKITHIFNKQLGLNADAELASAIEQRKRYMCYLKSKGVSLADDLFFESIQHNRAIWTSNQERHHRHTILNFQTATYNIWSLFAINENKRNLTEKKMQMQQVKIEQTKRFLQPLSFCVQPDSLLCNRFCFKLIKQEARWAQLEGKLQQEIPLAQIAKLHDPKNLTFSEEQELLRWVERLNQEHPFPSPFLFFKVMQEAHALIQIEGTSTVTLGDIFLWLEKNGCQVVNEADQLHLDWRDALQLDQAVECSGKILKLGRLLSPDKLSNDVSKVFEIKEYPDCVLKISNNRFRLYIEQKKAEKDEEQAGIEYVKTREPGLDLKGRCVVQEKLLTSFETFQWKSNNHKLIREEENIALAICSTIYCLCEWKKNLPDFAMKNLMLSNGILKIIQPLKLEKFNYITFEEVVQKFAKGNRFIFSFLMHVSKLKNHVVAEFFQSRVENAFLTGNIELVSHYLPSVYASEIYDKHVTRLCNRALEIRTNSVEKIMTLLRKEQHDHTLKSETEEQVGAALKELYSLSLTRASIQADIEDEIINCLERTPKNLPPDIISYYKQCFTVMYQRNQRMLREIEDET